MHTSPNIPSLSLDCLENALTFVPGYASWKSLDPGPSRHIDERFAALPSLSKQQIRDHFPTGLIPKNMNFSLGMASGVIELAQTSGSTDDVVTIVFNRQWWEASEKDSWMLNSFARQFTTGSHREAVLASPRCVGPGFSPSPLSVEQRTLGRHLYLNQKINPASWSDDDVRLMADELAAFKPITLEGDPAYLAAFALRANHLSLALYQPRLVFLTYSYPSRLYRRRIQSAFNAPQSSSYGSTETGHVFTECEAGRLHQNQSHCRVDFIPWHPRHGSAPRGRLLVSVFHNPWFTVLRFDVGDVARLDDRGPCPCGRHEGLTLASIDGRTKDVSFTPGGRPVTVDDIDSTLTYVPRLEGWQADHPHPGQFLFRILSTDPANPAPAQECHERLQALYGLDASITVLPCLSLEHEPSGKFRFCRSAFPIDHSTLWNDSP